jgi:hypothetical protein
MASPGGAIHPFWEAVIYGADAADAVNEKEQVEFFGHGAEGSQVVGHTGRGLIVGDEHGFHR